MSTSNESNNESKAVVDESPLERLKRYATKIIGVGAVMAFAGWAVFSGVNEYYAKKATKQELLTSVDSKINTLGNLDAKIRELNSTIQKTTTLDDVSKEKMLGQIKEVESGVHQLNDDIVVFKSELSAF